MSNRPKVEMIQTPSEKIINRKVESAVEMIDSLGRKIVLEKPDILDHYDFFRALGVDSSNAAMMGMAAPLLYVKSIDGIMFKKPQTSGEIRAGLKQVGTLGLKDVLSFLSTSDLIDATDEEEQKEELKK